MIRHIILIVKSLHHEGYPSTLLEKSSKASQSTGYRIFLKDRASCNYQDTIKSDTHPDLFIPTQSVI